MDYARYSIAANPNDLIRDVIQKVQDACNEAGDKVSVKSLFCAASLDPAATVKASSANAMRDRTPPAPAGERRVAGALARAAPMLIGADWLVSGVGGGAASALSPSAGAPAGPARAASAGAGATGAAGAGSSSSCVTT